MLPESIIKLAEKFRIFPGVGVRSSQKLSLDILQMSDEQYNEFMIALKEVREKVHFCKNCGFFAQNETCNICSNSNRNSLQICLVEKPTDVITLERSEIYRGQYHVLKNLISPLENIFPENTTLSDLLDRRILLLIGSEKFNQLVHRSNEIPEKVPTPKIELILFFKAGFAAEATLAYLRETLQHKNLLAKVTITRLAQGLPLYFNPETLDHATMAKALEDRREV